VISHITLGTNDLSKAIAFYDQILGLFGAKQIAKTEDVVFYAFPGSDTKLSITKPHNKETATYGNGTMVALKVNSNELVKKVYQSAMRLGSTR
jgi:catechol 2,3-dioxygenase-like lactoylglutathione lyase family enzyme